MSRIPAGTEVVYTVTWLEMTEAPAGTWPVAPVQPPVALFAADAAPVWYFLSLYDAVGRDYAWEHMHREEAPALREMLGDRAVGLYTLMADGWPHGFFLMDWRIEGTAELAYFGLVPEAIGRGLGSFLLETAIHTGWSRPGVARMTVNTCTLDHPRALGLYQKHGFVPIAQEERRRVLSRGRDADRLPD